MVRCGTRAGNCIDSNLTSTALSYPIQNGTGCLTITNCHPVTHALQNGLPCRLGLATKAPVSSGTCTVLAFRKHFTDANTGFCTRQTSVPTFIQTKAVASGWSTPTRLPRYCLMNVPVSLSNIELRPSSAPLVNQSTGIPNLPTHLTLLLSSRLSPTYCSGPRRCHLLPRSMVARYHQFRPLHRFCIHVHDGTQSSSQR
jgi:hypothetical protein